MTKPFSYNAFLVPHKTLHFFGPAAKVVADSFVEQAVRGGWAFVEWAGCSVPFPSVPSGKKTVVYVPINGRDDFMVWSFLLPKVSVIVRDSPVLLVGVSEADVVPTAWRFCAHARFQAVESGRLVIVKDKVTFKYQANTYILVDGDTWTLEPEPEVESDLDVQAWAKA